jgi:hypothetical protein
MGFAGRGVFGIGRRRKKDGDTPIRSGQAQRGEQRGHIEKLRRDVGKRAANVPRSLHSAARRAKMRRAGENRAAAVGMTIVSRVGILPGLLRTQRFAEKRR